MNFIRNLVLPSNLHLLKIKQMCYVDIFCNFIKIKIRPRREKKSKKEVTRYKIPQCNLKILWTEEVWTVKHCWSDWRSNGMMRITGLVGWRWRTSGHTSGTPSLCCPADTPTSSTICYQDIKLEKIIRIFHLKPKFRKRNKAKKLDSSTIFCLIRWNLRQILNG